MKQLDLFMGDCLELLRELPDGSVDLVLCDLPYGTTACAWDSVIPFDQLWAEYLRVAKMSAPIVLTAAQPFTSALVMSNPKIFKYQWVWQKDAGTGFGNANRQPLRDHEDVVVFYRRQPTYNPQFTQGKPYKQVSRGGNHASSVYAGGGLNPIETDNDGRRFPKTVLSFARDRNKIHPTQKPVALMEYLILTYTNEGDVVLDNTMGSGTTGVAAVKNGRRFIGMEKDPTYFEIAQQRVYETAFGDLA